MALTRKPRRVGNSWTVRIPADVAAMLDLPSVESVEFETVGREQILLRLQRRTVADGRTSTH